MKAFARIGSRPYALRKTAGALIALTGLGLALHAGLVTLAAFSVSVAAALALIYTLLLALILGTAAGMTAALAVRAEPVPLALPAARPWR